MKGQSYKDFKVKMFRCKDIANFNSLVVLHHLELLMSTENLQNKQHYFTHELTETACTYIMSPAEASQQVSCQHSKTKETNFKMAILGSFFTFIFCSSLAALLCQWKQFH